MPPLVSVLMTAYNREKYISEAIESVLNQTYKNWELIIVDDRSTDSTVDIANHYANLDPRIRVYVNEKNLSDYPNRNRAASYARGKYLKYLDSDDKLYPHALEIMVDAMEKFPEAGFAVTKVKRDPQRMFPYQISPYEAYRRHYFENDIFNHSPLSYIIRAEVFRKLGGFREEKNISDYEMWHRIAMHYPVVLLQDGLTWYRRHSEQQMVTDNSDPIVLHRYFSINYHYLNHPDCPLSGEEKTAALKKIREKEARLILFALRKFGLKKAKQLLDNSGYTLVGVLALAPKFYVQKTVKCLFK